MVTQITDRSLEVVWGFAAAATAQRPQPSILEPQKRMRAPFAGLVGSVGEYFWKLHCERQSSRHPDAISPREKAWVDAYMRYGPFLDCIPLHGIFEFGPEGKQHGNAE